MQLKGDVSAAVANLADALIRNASAARQRRALVISGDQAWCRQVATVVLSTIDQANTLWLSDQPPQGVTSITNQASLQWLGRECLALVYDAHTGFDADAFAALSGTVKGGGLLLLLTPELKSWPDSTALDPERYGPMIERSYFIQRLVGLIETSADVVVLTEGVPVPVLQPEIVVKTKQPKTQPPCLSLDQQQAVESIVKVVRGHRRRPAVLVSDRGRGKSSALGIAAAQLLKEGLTRIIVTGPRLVSLEPVFEHAARLLPDVETKKGVISIAGGSLAFMPPDELLLDGCEVDLLLIDEAAAIPAPVLAKLVAKYSRIVFATTVYGYEGTGRGFAIKFNQLLDLQAPGWKLLRLETPIRWAENDPVERFVFDALLLNAAIADDAHIEHAHPEFCQYQRLEREQLLQDEALLSQLFGLLVLAHYRTRPNDLYQLLDADNLTICVARYQLDIVAVALLVEEGGLEPAIAQAVYEGRRRLHGHLVPQSLAAHVGIADAPCLRYARVMRIAVHPALQGRGIGTAMLQAVRGIADAESFDCVAASFGGSVELLRFWQRAGYQPVRVGLTREHTSGAHSLMMLSGLNSLGKEIVALAGEKYFNGFVHLLSDPLRELDPVMAVAVMQGQQSPQFDVIDEDDWLDLSAFAYAQRGYESVMAPLWHLVCGHLYDATAMAITTENEKTLLLAKVLQRRDWQNLTQCLNLSGRREAIEILRRATALMLAHYRK